MTQGRNDEPTIGSFIRSEIPEEGDKALVQDARGDTYEVENMGLWPPTTK
jgi:hypothetical protein